MLETNINQWTRNCFRLFHSKNGVYGYKPKVKKGDQFQVAKEIIDCRNSGSNIYRWIQAYRTHGHRIANINPVAIENGQRFIRELDPSYYGLHIDQAINYKGLVFTQNEQGSLVDLEAIVKSFYCNSIGIEFQHLESEEEREWFTWNYENTLSQTISMEYKLKIAEILQKSQAWDQFMAVKFPTVKRFGGEGAETLLAFFWKILYDAVQSNKIDHLIMAIGHRGKMNLATILFNLSPTQAFLRYMQKSEFSSSRKVTGDMPLCYPISEDILIDGKSIRVSVVPNSAHLESANSISMGKTRSVQQRLKDCAFSEGSTYSAAKVINIQVHGDASFPGQGINQESLMLQGLPHFDIGGTIHLIVNNQLGFTTPGNLCRGTNYCTDLAKAISAPILHVNGDDPEAMVQVARLAFDYRCTFGKDVFIDLNCYRLRGHNELDDPTLTNPLLYKIIHSKRTVPDMYADQLVNDGFTSREFLKEISIKYKKFLNEALENIDSFEPKSAFQRQWANYQSASDSITHWDTGLDSKFLQFIGRASVTIPPTFAIHPHLMKTHISPRLEKLRSGQRIDWALAEALAIGSLMYQGYNCRLCGQDVGRGTFSHRHLMLVDQITNEILIPLNVLPGQTTGKLEMVNSILSEQGVLGFEYGISQDDPQKLVMWEAQFGDFSNCAQVIYDEYISSGEAKWGYCSGLIMLLPHGYDGGGPNHSSCRLERYLQSTDSSESSPDTDDVNVHIINPTTPAQYFHLLRRQMLRNFRKPLVVVAPKTLLRLKEASSSYPDFEPGQIFQPLLKDAIANPVNVQRIIFCSGKHFYNLNELRLQENRQQVSIIRIESLCPFPVSEINEEIARYKNATSFIWSQEEPRNMGAWTFIKPRFENMCGRKISYRGRPVGSATACGFSDLHQIDAINVVRNAFI